jgi:hypothetical protein
VLQLPPYTLLLQSLLLQGIGYYKPLTQFSKGEYPGANQLQDDLAIIAGKLGYAPKTNGASIATATPMPATVSGATANSIAFGVVQKAGEPEFFKFQAAAGPATVKSQLTPSFTNAMGGVDNRADLDMRVTVTDASGAVIATLNPPSFDNANTLEVAESAINIPAAGVYYVAVAGAGSGDPKSGGYSDYGESCCCLLLLLLLLVVLFAFSALHVLGAGTCNDRYILLLMSPCLCTCSRRLIAQGLHRHTLLPSLVMCPDPSLLALLSSPGLCCRVPWAFCSVPDLPSPPRRS